MGKIDFVIPCHSKDFLTLTDCVNGIKNIKTSNKIYVIANDNPCINDVEFINENEFDKYFTLNEIISTWKKRYNLKSSRSNWLYQQFLKLYSYRIIKNLTESFVVVDSDVIFLNDIEFHETKFYYNIVTEYHLPYLYPIKKLLGVDETIGFSTISHHQSFNKKYLNMMFDEIENISGMTFFKTVLSCIDYTQGACFSEWDLYSNYMILNHKNESKNRQLRWKNINYVPNENQKEELKTKYDFVASHAYACRGLDYEKIHKNYLE